jgi:hypothetical protein
MIVPLIFDCYGWNSPAAQKNIPMDGSVPPNLYCISTDLLFQEISQQKKKNQ